MNPDQDHDAIWRGKMGTGRPSASCAFAAPLGAATRGHLIFASGAAGATIRAAHGIPDLYRAFFARALPGVWVQDGTVTIQYRRFPFLDWLVSQGERLADVLLNDMIPWEVEFRGGVSKVTADLRELQLVALDVNGGASKVRVLLPHPVGTGYIRIAGGASNVTFSRPDGAAVRIRVGGGASRLTLDGQHFGAIGGDMRWESPGYTQAAARYDIEIVGGASHVTITTWQASNAE